MCTSFRTDNHASTLSLNFTGRMQFLTPNQRCQSTEPSLALLKSRLVQPYWCGVGLSRWPGKEAVKRVWWRRLHTWKSWSDDGGCWPQNDVGDDDNDDAVGCSSSTQLSFVWTVVVSALPVDELFPRSAAGQRHTQTTVAFRNVAGSVEVVCERQVFSVPRISLFPLLFSSDCCPQRSGSSLTWHSVPISTRTVDILLHRFNDH